MKKFIALCMVVIISISLCACGNKVPFIAELQFCGKWQAEDYSYITLSVESNSTYTLAMDAYGYKEQQSGTYEYDADSNCIHLYDESGDKCDTAEYKDGKLTFMDSDFTLVRVAE